MDFSDFGIEIPTNKVAGQVYTICPKCSHERKKKTAKCLGVNLDEGVWHCNHCEWSGSIKRNAKRYVRPKFENKTTLSEKLVDWFLQRNITQDTLVRMKITEGLEFMPQAGEKRSVICFNYFRDGKLVNVKYRDAEKNFKMVKDAELIFYNLDGIKGKDTAYIVEGEMDCLTMVQAGYTNTISVPSGANKGKNNLQYLDNCHEYFKGIKTVYILTDNDEPGKKLGEELARRIGIEKCLRVDLGPYKDINDALCKGANVAQVIANTKPFPIVGVSTIEDYWEAVLDVCKNGRANGWKPRGKLGEHVQFYPGYTTVLIGIPGHGKSELLDFFLMQLMIDYDLRGAYFSPENYPVTEHIIKLGSKLLGKSFEHKATDRERRKVCEYLKSRVNWIELDGGYTIDSILERVRQCVLSRGVNWYVLDPWNRIEHHYTDSETKYISQVLDKIANFNKQNGVHCFLIAHPTKMKFNHEAGRYEVPGPYDAAGSANFYNKADNFISVYREPLDPGEPDVYRVSVHVQKVKFKHWGRIGQVNLFWNKENGRYHEAGADFTDWIEYRPKATTEYLPF